MSHMDEERRIFEAQQVARSRLVQRIQPTPPGDESQIEAQIQHSDRHGDPLDAVVDGQYVRGETKTWMAMAQSLMGAINRKWYFVPQIGIPMLVPPIKSSDQQLWGYAAFLRRLYAHIQSR